MPFRNVFLVKVIVEFPLVHQTVAALGFLDTEPNFGTFYLQDLGAILSTPPTPVNPRTKDSFFLNLFFILKVYNKYNY